MARYKVTEESRQKLTGRIDKERVLSYATISKRGLKITTKESQRTNGQINSHWRRDRLYKENKEDHQTRTTKVVVPEYLWNGRAEHESELFSQDSVDIEASNGLYRAIWNTEKVE